MRSFQTKPDITNGLLKPFLLRNSGSSSVFAPNPYNTTRRSHNVRTKYGDTGDETSGVATRRLNRAPGLAQGHPVRAAAAWSDRLGWVGLERRCAAMQRRAFELDPPALTHHMFALYVRPPEELDLMYEGVKRHVPPPAGAIILVPAGSPAGWRRSGRQDLLQHLPGARVGRAGSGRRGVRPRSRARLTVPPLDGLDLPHLRAAMTAVGAPN